MPLSKLEKISIGLGSLAAIASIAFVGEYTGWIQSVSGKTYPLVLSNGKIEVSIIGGAVSVSALLDNPTSEAFSVVFACSVYDSKGNLVSNSTNGIFTWEAGSYARVQTDPKGLYAGNVYTIKAWVMGTQGDIESNTLEFTQSI